MYQVFVERSAEKDLKRLAAEARPRIISAIKTLAETLARSAAESSWALKTIGGSGLVTIA